MTSKIIRRLNKKIERRRFLRHSMCFPLSFRVARGREGKITKEEISLTNDVSWGGLLFSAKHRVEKGTPIVITMPVQDKIFKVKAKVARCVINSDAKLYDIGVYFQRFSEAFKVKLIEQMYLISEYRELRSVELDRMLSMQEASEEWIKRYSARFQRIYW